MNFRYDSLKKGIAIDCCNLNQRMRFYLCKDLYLLNVASNGAVNRTREHHQGQYW